MSRLPVIKTPKVYVGGAFVRSESGRVFPLPDSRGEFVAHIPTCTRKDLRNAVEAATKARPDWARRTPYNRGQILYRLAEMLEGRADEMATGLRIGSSATTAAARREVTATCDRLVYFAGWADKYEQLLGSTNPVAGSYFNFTVCEPVGTVGIIAGDDAPLLGLVSQIAPAIVSGNAVVALASPSHPYPAILLGEALAVSDVPAGVVNLLTGSRNELVPTFATHAQLRAIDAVVSSDEEARQLGLGAAESVKRLTLRRESTKSNWLDLARHENLYAIRELVEFKTIWHPIGA